MKSGIYVFIILITLCSLFACKPLKHEYEGNYLYRGKDFTYILKINKDSTFFLNKKYFEFDSKCQGKWSILTKDSILLTCEDEELFSQMTMGYMAERKHVIKFLNSRKIKINKVVLKKMINKL